MEANPVTNSHLKSSRSESSVEAQSSSYRYEFTSDNWREEAKLNVNLVPNC